MIYGKRKKKMSSPFGDVQKAALGMTGAGVTIGVGAAVAGRASQAAGGADVGQSGFSTMASFMPVMGTAAGGMAAMKAAKKLKKRGLY